MTDLPTPILRALVIPATAGRGAQAVVWCPYCEAIHHHGAVPGHRVAHCATRKSPYCATGYDLDLQGDATTAEAVVPSAVYAGRRRLQSMLERAAPVLRAAFLRAVFGTDRARARFEKKIGSTRVSVRGHAWTIDPDGFVSAEALGSGRPWSDRVLRGTGSLRLLAALYGVPPGVVAARLLSTVAGDDLDARAWHEISAAIDAWAQRQDLRREGGR